ncbi:MAG: hypothetical protein LBS30_03775 [Planctomycetota bacterium]|nr:hypothetical protein [Planctomycetota bacterium]
MDRNDMRTRDSARIILDPPTFSPTPEMRGAYLQRRKGELDALMDHARAGEWKPVMTIVNHIRGTGAMYGFPGIGDAAANVVRAVQNGDTNSLTVMEEYAGIVAGASV